MDKRIYILFLSKALFKAKKPQNTHLGLTKLRFLEHFSLQKALFDKKIY
jgi:hypothetical protein